MKLNGTRAAAEHFAARVISAGNYSIFLLLKARGFASALRFAQGLGLRAPMQAATDCNTL